jgi:serine/threonine protein kinase/predicted Zn-dependent protease
LRLARLENPGALLTDFVPASDHADYTAATVELIRFDRAWHAQRGTPKTYDEYRRGFPGLFADPATVRSLSMAQPVPATEASVAARAAEHTPGIWLPSAGRLLDEVSPFRIGGVTNAVHDGPASEAARHQQFGLSSDTNHPRPAHSVRRPAGDSPATLEVLHEIYRSNPEFAVRLDRATSCMPEAGTDILGFQLIDEIGRGAFGRVFLAREKELAGRLVVVKITAESPGESQTLAQLQHTNIVPIYSVRVRDPFHALCMPFFGTTTLADAIGSLWSDGKLPVSGKHFVSTLNGRKRGASVANGLSATDQPPTVANTSGRVNRVATAPSQPPPVPGSHAERLSTLQSLEGRSYVHAVLWIGARLAEGLYHAHQRGILHRDLKPANVLLADDGRPMVLDFNLSEDVKLRSSAAARAGGTLPYMSPEQLVAFRGGPPLDGRSDVYSLGLILFELLTGRRAFPTRTGPVDDVVALRLADCKSMRPRVRPYNPQVSPAAESIVLRCLAPDPAQRYQSASELLEDLERHLDDQPLRYAPEPSLRERASKWYRRHPRLMSSTSVGIGCGVCLLILATLFAVRLQKARRLEALDNLAGFREQVAQAKYLLNKSAPDRNQLKQGAQLCTDALARYRVLEGAAAENLPAVRDLPSDDDRAALRNDIGEALLALTRATLLQAQQESDAAARAKTAEFGLALLDLLKPDDGQAGGSQVALRLAAELHRILGQEDVARRQAAAADSLKPQSAGDLYMLALRLGDRREFARAVPLLRESTRRDPKDVWAWFYQGYCHLESGDFAEAVRCCTVSIALTPRRADAFMPLFNRGLAYARLGQFAQACDDFDAAVSLRPGSMDARINRGIARIDAGRCGDAIADFDECLRIDPGMTRLYLLRARARAQAGDTEGADRDRRQGLRDQPGDELSWIDRALARADAEPAAALADLDQALCLNPQSLLALQNKAHVLGELLDRQQEAVAVLDKAVALYPGFVRARVGRGVHLARLGRRAESIADAREALARSGLGETYYQASNIYAINSRAHPEDGAESCALLAEALRRGFGLEYVDKDADFDAVRNNQEFQRVVRAARELQAAAGKLKR